MRTTAISAVLFLSVSCAVEPDGTPAQETDWGYLDYTVDVPPPPAGGYQMTTPIVEIPAYTEAQTCNFETWEGPDMGVVAAMDYYHRDVVHHTAILDVQDDTYPDGEVVNCELQGSSVMDAYGLLFEGGGPELTEDFEAPGPSWEVTFWDDEVANVSMIGLPDGVAFPLFTGQRLAIDFHVLNPFDQPIRTNAAYNFTLVPPSEVEHWARAGMLDSAPFTLPTGDTEMTFDCPFDSDTNITNIQPHMHDYGSEYIVEVVRLDGSLDRVLHVEDWTPDLKTGAPFTHYEEGELIVKAGESIRTVCRWSNPTGVELPYPTEMCTTAFVGYPMDESMVCFGNVEPEPVDTETRGE